MTHIATFLLCIFCMQTWGVAGEDLTGDGGHRCHDPPKAAPAHLLLPSANNASGLFALRSNQGRLSRREGLADTSTHGLTEGRRTAAQNFTFPNIVYTSGCRDSSGYTCDACCNGVCCQKVVGVASDALYNNSEEVVQRTGGFSDITTTAILVVPVRIILIVSSGARQTLTVDSINNQLAIANAHYSYSRIRFVAYSFDRVVNDSMSSGCSTNPCQSDPDNCYFFKNTLPQFVRGNTSALDVMNVFLCTTIDYLGEAWFPWASVETSPINYVQVQYNAWNAILPATLYGLGMTLVHEIGHYFGALHTFERDGYCDIDGDYVNDTVACKAAASISEACSNLRNSCGQGNDDLSNIMNYAADKCMQNFSTGQFKRMEQATVRYRHEFVRRHLVEMTCPMDGANNNLEACWCADGSSPATLCGIYSERLPITLFLPGSYRYNGQLYNSPDPTAAPKENKPLLSAGVIIVVALVALVSFVGIVAGCIVICCCTCFRVDQVPLGKQVGMPSKRPPAAAQPKSVPTITKPKAPHTVIHAEANRPLTARGQHKSALKTAATVTPPISTAAAPLHVEANAVHRPRKGRQTSIPSPSYGRQLTAETFSLRMSSQGEGEVASQTPAATLENPDFDQTEFTDHTPRSEPPEEPKDAFNVKEEAYTESEEADEDDDADDGDADANAEGQDEHKSFEAGADGDDDVDLR